MLIPDDAHDLYIRQRARICRVVRDRHTHRPSNGVRGAEEGYQSPRQFLVDQDDTGRTKTVALIEVAPGHQGNVEGTEVVGIDALQGDFIRTVLSGHEHYFA